MTGDDCSDCGLPHHLHFREDGLYGCPVDTPMSTDGAHQEPTGLHNCVTRPNVHNTSTERVRSESPDPLLLAPDKQLPQRYSTTQRRSIHSVDMPMPLRRSFRVENRRRVREGAEPYTQSKMRRSSLRTPGDAFRRSYPRRASLQDNRRSSRRSSENEGVSLEQNRPPERFPRASPQRHVLERMVPVEDMEMIEGFQPFTELEPGQQREPVTLREPVTDASRGPFQYAWNPSVTFPVVGGMRVRVGQFERTEHRADDATPLAWSDGNESSSSASGSSSEGYFTAQDWTPSFTPSANPPQPDFIQGSSKSVLPPQTWAGADTYPPSIVANEDAEFPQLEALAQHFTAVHEKSVFATPPAPASCPPVDPKHPEGLTTPRPHQDIDTSAPQNQLSHAMTLRHPSRPIMPGTLPGTRITDYRSSDSGSTPAERVTEAAVDEREDWATREPWEYVHRVLTSSTHPLVMFLKTPTADIPAAALGVLSADLRLQKMLVDNEHWLLVGPRGVDLHEFGVRFQTRARTPDKLRLSVREPQLGRGRQSDRGRGLQGDGRELHARQRAAGDAPRTIHGRGCGRFGGLVLHSHLCRGSLLFFWSW
ncbi:hypothetical protein EDB89DRAFT_494820 [Lactarius sanguifluus]|nr:hypothetical protein EDB89DRAFT_494820 [Lactarius sanguifluus]